MLLYEIIRQRVDPTARNDSTFIDDSKLARDSACKRELLLDQ
jgi:hypothetical protein